jgi:hypothetical protein
MAWSMRVRCSLRAATTFGMSMASFRELDSRESVADLVSAWFATRFWAPLPEQSETMGDEDLTRATTREVPLAKR